MIKPEDCEFHFKADSHWQWAETLALPFCVPEANINVIVYLVTRPMMGVCMCDITVIDRITDLWEEQAYIDNQQHLPCPKSLLEFSLPNGLSVKAVDPLKRYRVTYEGIDDTRFSLDYVALHEPYDINDPAMDPMAAKRNGPAWDSSWSGHYETTYRITGEFILRGKRYAVDCVETGDRSWGPRPERDNSSVIWWHASFGEELTVHLFTGHDIAKTNEMGPHISGYVLERGELYGITAARGAQDYRRAVPMGGELEVTDIRGRKTVLTYSTVNCCYWAPYPSNTYLQSSLRVACEGRIGHGVQQLGLSRAYLTRNRDAIRARY
ncbi:MAG: hypothetical protein ABWZ40_13820 [Caulobacterales bacterium]